MWKVVASANVTNVCIYMYIKHSRTSVLLLSSTLRGLGEGSKKYRNYKFQHRKYVLFVLDHLPDVMGEAEVPDKIIIAV